MPRSAPSRHHRRSASAGRSYEVHTVRTDPEHANYDWGKIRTSLTKNEAQKLAKRWAEGDELAIVRKKGGKYDHMLDAELHYINGAPVTQHEAERWADGEVID
jgi:hypothetical protein